MDHAEYDDTGIALRVDAWAYQPSDAGSVPVNAGLDLPLIGGLEAWREPAPAGHKKVTNAVRGAVVCITDREIGPSSTPAVLRAGTRTSMWELGRDELWLQDWLSEDTGSSRPGTADAGRD